MSRIITFRKQGVPIATRSLALASQHSFVQGVEAIEPVPPPEYVFYDDFESGAKSPLQDGYGWTAAYTLGNPPPEVVSGFGRNSTYSNRHRYVPNPGHSIDVSQGYILGVEVTEVWFDWWVLFPVGYAMGSNTGTNNKFFLCWRDVYSGQPPHTWQFAFEFLRISPTVAYLRPMYKTSTSPNTTSNNVVAPYTLNNPFISANGLIVPGTWARIRVHAKTASAALAFDGVLEMWVGDQLAFRKSNGDFWNYGSDPTTVLRRGYILGAANTGYDVQTDIYVDDVTFHIADPNWGLP